MFKFRKKKRKENIEKKKELALTEFIVESKKRGYTDEQIKEILKEKSYPSKLVNSILELNTREVKMAKEEEYDEEDEFEEDEEDENEVVEPVKEEVVVPVKKKRPKVIVREVPEVKETEKEPTLKEVTQAVQAMGQVVNELSTRLQTIESSLYRMRNL